MNRLNITIGCALAFSLIAMAEAQGQGPTAAPAPANSAEKIPVPLVRGFKPSSQKIPLIIIGIDGNSARTGQIEIEWLPDHESTSTGTLPEFLFDDGLKPESARVIESQLWLAAMSAGFVLQDTWQQAAWRIKQPPINEEESFLAALAVGLIATACGIDYPQDLAIVGGLNWDNSLSAAESLEARLRAAQASGIKRLIIPASQRVLPVKDSISNIETVARSMGIQILLADDLTRAAELALGAEAPALPMLRSYPRYGGTTFEMLYKRCNEELSMLNNSKPSWPASQADLLKKPARDQALWMAIQEHYHAGMDAYRAGEFYAAFRRFMGANALVSALANRPAAVNISTDREILETYVKHAGELRETIDRLLKSEHFTEKELNRAVVAAEGEDFLWKINSDLVGRQVVLVKAIAPDSAATSEEKQLVTDLFFDSVNMADYQLKRWPAIKELFDLTRPQAPIDVFGRGGLWLPQLILTHLARARLFTQGLKRHATKVHMTLPWDAELASYSRFLSTAKSEASRLPPDVYSGPMADVKPKEEAAGFKPGESYNRRKTVVEDSQFLTMSDVTQCLVWGNLTAELGVLEQKYLKVGGDINTKTMAWTPRDVTRLRQRLVYAEHAARRGIAFANSIGVEDQTLAYSYEWASHLRESSSNEEKLEALRQYWRCSILGGLAWQLSFVPRARVAPLTEAELATNAAPSTASIPAPPAVPATASRQSQQQQPAPAPREAAIPRAEPLKLDENNDDPYGSFDN